MPQPSTAAPAPIPAAPTLIPDPAVYTLLEFCRVHHLCRSTLYGLWKKGEGPKSYRLGRRRYIRGQDAHDWRQGLKDQRPGKDDSEPEEPSEQG